MNFDVIGAAFFVFGAIFGSFLNVCIHRFPREESIVSPGSHCPHCSTPVKWYDNVPLVSYVLLLGRCRKCKAVISPRYVFVELATALIWLLFYLAFGITGQAVAGIYLFTVLMAVTCTDFETGYIPDKFTLPSIIAGLVLSAAYPEIQDQAVWYRGLLNSFAGFLIGGGILLATGVLGNILFKKESMGGGDIKLLAMLGAFLGVKKIVLVFLIAPIAALPLALYTKYFKRLETIPFGPFIAIAGAWMFLYGNSVWDYFFAIH